MRSDTHTTNKTITAHENAFIDVYFGSKENSVLFATLKITWKDTDEPLIEMFK